MKFLLIPTLFLSITACQQKAEEISIKEMECKNEVERLKGELSNRGDSQQGNAKLMQSTIKGTHELYNQLHRTITENNLDIIRIAANREGTPAGMYSEMKLSINAINNKLRQTRNELIQKEAQINSLSGLTTQEKNYLQYAIAEKQKSIAEFEIQTNRLNSQIEKLLEENVKLTDSNVTLANRNDQLKQLTDQLLDRKILMIVTKRKGVRMRDVTHENPIDLGFKIRGNDIFNELDKDSYSIARGCDPKTSCIKILNENLFWAESSILIVRR